MVKVVQHRRPLSVDVIRSPSQLHVQWRFLVAFAKPFPSVHRRSFDGGVSLGVPQSLVKCLVRRSLRTNRRYMRSYFNVRSAASLDAPRSTLLQPAHAIGCQHGSPSPPSVPSAFFLSIALFLRSSCDR